MQIYDVPVFHSCTNWEYMPIAYPLNRTTVLG